MRRRGLFAFGLFAAVTACAQPRREEPGPVGPPIARYAPADAGHTEPPATLPFAALDLPVAQHGQPFAPTTRAVVTVAKGRVLLDGKDVGDSAALAAGGRLARVDGLFSALDETRQKWAGQHVSETFRGSVALAFEKTETLLVVKSVLQTAAFAGYTDIGFVVIAPSGSPAILRVDAQLPQSLDKRPEPQEGLVIDVSATSAVATWRRAGEENTGVSLGNGNTVTAMAFDEWRSHGLHKAPLDREMDRAFIYAGLSLPHSALIGVLDQLSAVERDWEVSGKVTRVAAFQPTLMIPDEHHGAGIPRSGVNGRLPPEAIQRVVRQNFAAFGGCYERALKKDRQLNGKVEVKFVIERDGRVSSAESTTGTTLPDPTAVACVVDGYAKLTFPKPEGGTVTVVYPIIFNPGD